VGAERFGRAGDDFAGVGSEALVDVGLGEDARHVGAFGCERASAMSARTLRAGSDGCETSSIGVDTT
jgi:hypothetical protein